MYRVDWLHALKSSTIKWSVALGQSLKDNQFPQSSLKKICFYSVIITTAFTYNPYHFISNQEIILESAIMCCYFFNPELCTHTHTFSSEYLQVTPRYHCVKSAGIKPSWYEVCSSDGTKLTFTGKSWGLDVNSKSDIWVDKKAESSPRQQRREKLFHDLTEWEFSFQRSFHDHTLS